MAEANSDTIPMVNIAVTSSGPQKTNKALTAPENSKAPINKFRLPNFFPKGAVIIAPPTDANIKATKKEAANN